MRTIKDIITDTEQAIAAEQSFEIEKRQPTSLEWLIQQLPGWKRFYLKRNQQRNHIRVTRLILPGTEENRHRWRHHFQIWVRGHILDEYVIDCDTFDYFYTSHDWTRNEHDGLITATLHPQP